MNHTFLRHLALAASLTVATTLPAAITFTYNAGKLTVEVDQNIDFTLTENAGNTVLLVFQGAYDSPQSPTNNPTGSGSLELSGSSSDNDPTFLTGPLDNDVDATDLRLGYTFAGSPGSIGDTITLNVGTVTSVFGIPQTPDPTLGTFSGAVFLADTSGDAITAVPEPGLSAAILGLVGGAFVLARRASQRRKR